MSFVSVNGTIPVVEGWSGYFTDAQEHLYNNQRLALLLLVNTPLFAIVLNVIRQLVGPATFEKSKTLNAPVDGTP